MTPLRKFITSTATLALVTVSMPAHAMMETSSGSATGSTAPAMSAPSVTAPRQPVAETAPKISEETAVRLAHQVLGIPVELGEPQVQYRAEDYNPEPRWEIRWESDYNAGDRRYYYVTVNAITGQITQYSYQHYTLPALGVTHTRESALAIARDKWLAALVPQYFSQLRLEENAMAARYFYGYNAAQYSYYFQRVQDGVPVQDQGVNITIDALTGDLVSYYLTWRDAKFEPAEHAVSLDEARDMLYGTAELQLAYHYMQQQWDLPGEWQPVYMVGALPAVDVATGELLLYGRPYEPRERPAELMPQLETPWSRPAQPLTRDQALALAHKVAGIPLETKPSSMNTRQGQDPKPHLEYSFYWHQMHRIDDYMTTSSSRDVSIDALNGIVTRYSNWGGGYPGESRPTELVIADEESARKAIVEFVQMARPDLVPHLYTRPYESYGRLPWDEAEEDDQRQLRREYEMGFEYRVDGIPLNNVHLSVMLDLYTGQIRNFWIQWDDRLMDLSLPSLDGILPEQDALAAWFEQAPVELAWLQRAMEPSQPPTQTPTYYLAYRLKSPGGMVDAHSGHALDYYGRDLLLSSTRPTDIEGHWAAREIEWLLARGIFEPTGEQFNPDGGVTQGEAIRWLVSTIGSRPYVRSKYDFELAANPASEKIAPFLEAAIRSGVIKLNELDGPFDAEAPMERQKLALLIARALRYGEIAAMDVSMNLPYTDADAIGAPYRNAVGILAGLGIVGKGEGIAFRPADTLTRGEAARILYGVIVHRANQGMGSGYYYY